MSIFRLALLIVLLLGLLSTALLGFGFYFVINWFLSSITVVALLVSGIVMLVFSPLGRFVILWLLASPAEDELTSIISANKDGATVVEASHYMHKEIENLELVVLTPSGHMSMMEQHQEFVEAVASFARRCSRSTYSCVN